MLTLDLQILGQRHKDMKNGLSAPPKLTIPNIINMMTKPRWCLGMLGTQRRKFGNIVGHVKGVENMGSLSEWTAKQFDPALSWDDVEWIKKRWGGKLILKGIQDVEDARLAVDQRRRRPDRLQPRRPPARRRALVHLGAAGDRRCGGHGASKCTWTAASARGQHVLKAVALGAKGTYIGRACSTAWAPWARQA